MGLKTIPEESILNAAASFVSGNRFLFLPKSNIVFLSDNDMEKYLEENFTGIEKASVSKNIFNGKVEISVAERNPDFLWCSSSCFLMSKDGLVFEAAEGSGAEEYPGKIIFRGMLGGNPMMKRFASPETMQNYENFVKDLGLIGIRVVSIYAESENKASAETDIGSIIFDPEEEGLSAVAHKVNLLIAEARGKDSAAHFEYIDARYGNKMFYKLGPESALK